MKSAQRNKSKKTLYIVASILMLLVSFSLLNNVVLNQAIESSEGKAINFLKDIDSRNYDSAYSKLSKSYREKINLKNFIFNMEIDYDSIGTISSRQIKSEEVEIDWKTKKVWSHITYESNFNDSQEAEEVLSLSSNLGRSSWSLESYQVHSNFLAKY